MWLMWVIHKYCEPETDLFEFEVRGRLVEGDGSVDVGDEEAGVVQPLGVGEDGGAPAEPK